MPPFSSVIHKLNPIIQHQLLCEFLAHKNSLFWGPHSSIADCKIPAPVAAANQLVFGQGLTYWIRSISADWQLLIDRTDQWPVLMQMIHATIGNRQLGRVFYHSLKPGKELLRHNDKKVPFRNQIANRYHLYLNVDNDVDIVLDDELVDNKIICNSVLDFNWLLDHGYCNRSQTDFAFVVFDVVTDDVKIH